MRAHSPPLGLRIGTGGTDTGLMSVDLGKRSVTGDLAAALRRANLAVDKNLIPFDPLPAEAPSSAFQQCGNDPRLWSFRISNHRGLDRSRPQNPTDMRIIAAVREEVRALRENHPIY